MLTTVVTVEYRRLGGTIINHGVVETWITIFERDSGSNVLAVVMGLPSIWKASQFFVYVSAVACLSDCLGG